MRQLLCKVQIHALHFIFCCLSCLSGPRQNGEKRNEFHFAQFYSLKIISWRLLFSLAIFRTHVQVFRANIAALSPSKTANDVKLLMLNKCRSIHKCLSLQDRIFVSRTFCFLRLVVFSIGVAKRDGGLWYFQLFTEGNVHFGLTINYGNFYLVCVSLL